MSGSFKHFFCASQLNVSESFSLFHRVSELKKNYASQKDFQDSFLKDKTVILAFLEPSTRTRLSFEMAAHRMKMRVLHFSDLSMTSVSKGESFFESFKNIAQIHPDLIVLRWTGPQSLWGEVETLNIPLINAGLGSEGHPTQALLDTFTLYEHFKNLEGLRVLFYGDIKHSRVFASHKKYLPQFGVKLSICCPDEFKPDESELGSVQRYSNLSEAIKDCDVVMGLRVQKERFQGGFDERNFIENFQLNSKTLELLNPQSLIMHPGPFNLGIELTHEILSDSRVKIYDQVENGVYMRAALMEKVLNE